MSNLTVDFVDISITRHPTDQSHVAIFSSTRNQTEPNHQTNRRPISLSLSLSL